MSKLWYLREAKEWEEALPLGNGRLGAMVYGIPKNEHIQLNEESIWYGGPVNRSNADAKDSLPLIRELIFAERIPEAEKLIKLSMSGCPNSMHPTQTLGDLIFEFDLPETVSEYRRELNLENSTAGVTFQSGKISYSREYFISKPANCFVMKLCANHKGKISFWAGIERLRFFDGIRKTADNEITMFGNLGRGGYEFTVTLRALNKGGRVSVKGERLVIEAADEVILLMGVETTYHCSKEEKERAYDAYLGIAKAQVDELIDTENISSIEKQELLMQKCLQTLLERKIKERLDKGEAAGYEQLLAEHICDYQKLFLRTKFVLEGSEEYDSIPTDERLRRVREGKSDIGLSKLYFDYGRYLLISCSRAGDLPANLQGIWNNEMTPAWDGKFTLNINMQMNYWLAENCNLSECHEPLFALIEKVVVNGRKTAREMYGCRGFVCHHNTDIHGDTMTQDVWVGGTYWVMGAAWLCTHQWKHYQYTRDIHFLQKHFPIMCEAALFFVDFLVEKDGYLVTCPSLSPENCYLLPNGEKCAISYGVTMDNQILRDLFQQCISAFSVLGERNALTGDVVNALAEAGIADIHEFIEQVTLTNSKLRETQIGENGTILEWVDDYKEWEPGHRHISHLYGLHPSAQITVDGTPELANAARKTLEKRLSHGGGHTGWSRAWIINHYAKLWDGEAAYHNIELLLSTSTYPNMFDKHPPFQIDGNFGGAAGIAEMLVQSSEKRVVLLPALPKAWSDGYVKGLCIIGNAEISVVWKKGSLVKCEIKAYSGMNTLICYLNNSIPIELVEGQSLCLSGEDFG